MTTKRVPKRWIVFLVNDEGWWFYERWSTPQLDLDMTIEDVVHGINSGIIQVPEGEAITLVEVEVK